MAYRFLTYVHFEIRHIEFEHKKTAALCSPMKVILYKIGIDQ